MTLTEFLLARIAEDEKRVLGIAAVVDATPGSFPVIVKDDPGLAMGDCPSYIADYDRRRALAECQAKRRIVEMAAPTTRDLYGVLSELDPLDLEDYTSGAIWGLTFAMRSLAAAYADHPDYQEEWKP